MSLALFGYTPGSVGRGSPAWRQKISRSMRKDIAGTRYGMLVAVERVGRARWSCRCDCGQVKVVWMQHLTSGGTKSCGCYRRKRLERDLVGRRFGRLTLEKRLPGSRWECRCSCGAMHTARQTHLVRGLVQSCGCLHNELAAQAGRARARRWRGVSARDVAEEEGISVQAVYQRIRRYGEP